MCAFRQHSFWSLFSHHFSLAPISLFNVRHIWNYYTHVRVYINLSLTFWIVLRQQNVCVFMPSWAFNGTHKSLFELLSPFKWTNTWHNGDQPSCASHQFSRLAKIYEQRFTLTLSHLIENNQRLLLVISMRMAEH